MSLAAPYISFSHSRSPLPLASTLIFCVLFLVLQFLRLLHVSSLSRYVPDLIFFLTSTTCYFLNTTTIIHDSRNNTVIQPDIIATIDYHGAGRVDDHKTTTILVNSYSRSSGIIITTVTITITIIINYSNRRSRNIY